jgi:hypothetical protein
VADTGGVAVSFPCRGAGTGEARGRLVMRAGQHYAGERGKGAAAWRFIAGRSERSRGERCGAR